ncbi:hypothetical protein T4D_1331 [Trichinella pseudospiralis]|uniref:Uncharacterized protein n=1 Tax=Trichinella pseudospiralis TaxID=6337 RepID=A0A0V1F3G7_TRIPS|nr:hypothetical protein T4D_1331 [Trichinella pseudospiralis]
MGNTSFWWCALDVGDTLRRVLTKSAFCCGIFCQIVYTLTEFQSQVAGVELEFIVENIIVYILTECRMSSISNAHEMVFTATCAVSDFYANKGGFKIVFVITVQEVKLTLLTKSNGERHLLNLFQRLLQSVVQANGVRRMSNGVFSAMADEESL